MIKPKSPIAVQFELINDCNHSCTHCYNFWRSEDEKLQKPTEKQLNRALEISERIKDYEQTFESELIDEKRKKVDDFALNVNKDRHMLSVDEVKQQKQGVELRGKVSEEEKNTIDKIMGNSFGFGMKKEEKKEDKEERE